MNKIVTLLVFLSFGFVQAQQLNCTVTINTERLTNPNNQVFKTLQTSLNEFINKTDWTGSVLKQNERINCSMYITLSSNSSDQFTGTIQVQSSRLIFNSTYSSPVLNFNDKDFNFRYNIGYDLLSGYYLTSTTGEGGDDMGVNGRIGTATQNDYTITNQQLFPKPDTRIKV